MTNYVNIINKQEEDNECMICFENVDIDFTYIKCHNCNKLFHQHCMDSWKNKKQQAFSVCIHCTKDELLLHETITTCCSCFKLTTKNKKKITKRIKSYD
tara:strand:+ start:2138 stop:2434 length:297 start_codon:yes stop_codon:yes gene_type:complete